MSDIGLFIDDEGKIDIDFESGDLKRDNGLETSVLISLFSDQRITYEELPPGETSQRGFWGDAYPEIEGDLIGSKLWVYDRAKRTDETLSRIREEAKNSLSWMVSDGVADSVETDATYLDNGALWLTITITKNEQSQRFAYAWDGQELKRD